MEALKAAKTILYDRSGGMKYLGATWRLYLYQVIYKAIRQEEKLNKK